MKSTYGRSLQLMQMVFKRETIQRGGSLNTPFLVTFCLLYYSQSTGCRNDRTAAASGIDTIIQELAKTPAGLEIMVTKPGSAVWPVEGENSCQMERLAWKVFVW